MQLEIDKRRPNRCQTGKFTGETIAHEYTATLSVPIRCPLTIFIYLKPFDGNFKWSFRPPRFEVTVEPVVDNGHSIGHRPVSSYTLSIELMILFIHLQLFGWNVKGVLFDPSMWGARGRWKLGNRSV